MERKSALSRKRIPTQHHKDSHISPPTKSLPRIPRPYPSASHPRGDAAGAHAPGGLAAPSANNIKAISVSSPRGICTYHYLFNSSQRKRCSVTPPAFAPPAKTRLRTSAQFAFNFSASHWLIVLALSSRPWITLKWSTPGTARSSTGLPSTVAAAW